jgi:hypothetical protein
VRQVADRDRIDYHQWVLCEGVGKLAAHERKLCATFIDRITSVAGLRYFSPRGVRDRVGVFSVRIEDLAPEELSAILETYYGILTRSGIHWLTPQRLARASNWLPSLTRCPPGCGTSLQFFDPGPLDAVLLRNHLEESTPVKIVELLCVNRIILVPVLGHVGIAARLHTIISSAVCFWLSPIT